MPLKGFRTQDRIDQDELAEEIFMELLKKTPYTEIPDLDVDDLCRTALIMARTFFEKRDEQE